MRPSSRKKTKKAPLSPFRRGYNSFNGGVDIRAVFGDRQIGTLQGIEYRITRNNELPTYTMGEAGTLADYDFDMLRIGNNLETEFEEQE
jgi:hypothetical protein